LDDFNRHPGKKWIAKPAGRSQGKGIFILTKPSQLKILSNSLFRNEPMSKENFVICKYIDNPLLIGGKKFDLRTYVLVTNYKPLRVWRYTKGFARFCNENYDVDIEDSENLYSHLTNVAV
jgi:tubulin polyglutamylase TTLL1